MILDYFFEDVLTPKAGIQVPKELAPRFRDDVLNILIEHGESAAISTVLTEMRRRGWRGITRLPRLDAYLRAEGFTLKHEERGETFWTRVTV